MANIFFLEWVFVQKINFTHFQKQIEMFNKIAVLKDFVYSYEKAVLELYLFDVFRE